MKYRHLIHAIAAFIPEINHDCAKGTGGTDSARYCYSVWLRHLVMAKNNGLNPFPKIVAELGPGDSLGVGLAALISGSDKYFAFDVIEYANAGRNLEIFDKLVTLFKNRAAIPANDEYPEVKPYLDGYDFPADILDENRLHHALEKKRIERIRDSITDLQRKDSPIQYKVPWYDASVLEAESVDMIYSQAVLEHVDDLPNTYKAMRLWLKPSGYISHQIDFRCHGTAEIWNGHWACSDFRWKLIDFMWKLIKKRSYSLNREPHSTHIALLKEEGYRVVCDKVIESKSGLTKLELAPRFKSISDDDLTTSGVFIQAMKIS